MQFSQNTFGSQNFIKELYRQNSTVIKNTPKDKNLVMTQSSNVPFNKFYNAFNSTGNLQSFGLGDRFKNSQAKSIIEKLMKTENYPKAEEDQFLLLNQLQNIQLNNSSEAIPLNSTQNRIFCEVVNLITQINEIKQRAQAQTCELQKLKLYLKNKGIQYPQIQEQRTDLKSLSLRRFTKEQLQAMFQQNQKLQKQLEQITKDLTNKKSQKNQEKMLDNAVKNSKVLRKQLSVVKSQILNSGEIDQQQVRLLVNKVQSLKQEIYILQQKHRGRLSERDEELSFLKRQNQQLRLKAIELMRNAQTSQRRQQLMQILQMQQQTKDLCIQQMKELKHRYQVLMNQSSSSIRQQRSIPKKQYDDRLQVESKVSPFRNNHRQYQQSYAYDKEKFYNNNEKENYLQTYEPAKNRQDAANINAGQAARFYYKF